MTEDRTSPRCCARRCEQRTPRTRHFCPRHFGQLPNAIKRDLMRYGILDHGGGSVRLESVLRAVEAIDRTEQGAQRRTAQRKIAV